VRDSSLRLKADYTGIEIEWAAAAEVVAKAESFVQTVERVFDLEGRYQGAGVENDKPDHGDKVSEPGNVVERMEPNYPNVQKFSLEEERRQARENWLRLRLQKIEAATDIGCECDAGSHAKEDGSHSADNALDQ
jgi:hypothetical protein